MISLVGPEIARQLPRRESPVPKIKPTPHFGAFGLLSLVEDGSSEAADQNSPSSDRPLNPPEGEPRIHFRRGAVWW